ncbi:MAG: hypothetical protein ABH886_01815 [Candidatus Desantisbacteria bacterium]
MPEKEVTEMIVGGYPSISFEELMVKPNIKPKEESFSSILEKEKMKLKTNNSPSIREELGKQYDIRKTTFEEFCDIALKLEETGEISHLDASVMTLDKTRKEDGTRNSDSAFAMQFATQADKDGKWDWVAEFEARAKQDLEYGSVQNYRQDQNIANFLKLLDQEVV